MNVPYTFSLGTLETIFKGQRANAFEGGAGDSFEIAAIATRSDGYIFILARDLRNKRLGWMVHAGCRNARTIAEYRQHARKEYPYCGPRWRRKLRETMAILDMFEMHVNPKRAWVK